MSCGRPVELVERLAQLPDDLNQALHLTVRAEIVNSLCEAKYPALTEQQLEVVAAATLRGVAAWGKRHRVPIAP